MTISNATIISELLKRVPEFHPNGDDVREGLTYPIINDLGRYICEKASARSHDEVKKAIDGLETLLAEGEESLTRLVGDCLWGLLECPEISDIAAFFGPRLRQLQNKYPPGA